jgi:hypothetical protein
MFLSVAQLQALPIKTPSKESLLSENVDKFVAVAFHQIPLDSTDFNRLAVSA